MPRDKEWLDMWEKKALIEDEYLRVGRGPGQDAGVICNDIKEKLLLNKNDRVLDIGCGSGAFDNILGSEVKCIIGYDTSFNMVKQANSNKDKKENVKFLQGETNILPFIDNSFSKVICYSSTFNYSIKTYLEAGEYLKEIKRVCKPGALVLIGELHDISQKWRVTPGRMRRVLNSFRKKTRPADMNEDVYYQKKWINKSLWYSRAKMLRVLKRLKLEGEIRERGKHLPYHEREFDILFQAKK